MLSKKITPLILLFNLFSAPLYAEENSQQHIQAIEEQGNTAVAEGIRFSCTPEQLKTIQIDMQAYFTSLGIQPDWVVKKVEPANGTVLYTLNTPKDDFSTLDLADRAKLKIKDEIVSLPTKRGKLKKVRTVSKKEIVLALLQHGRLTELKDSACDVEALKDHVGIRQNTATWAENLNWIWPDGGYAKWNEKFWDRGTPKPEVTLYDALNDVFLNQNRYAFGCYTATKLVMIRGALDYYRRIKKDQIQLELLEKWLFMDRDPLVNIEPGEMWKFEKDFDPAELNRPGKLLKIARHIAPKNFIPGDWIYILNTDPITYNKTGYEGSNAIYLGRNKFDDYYNDNNHSYTFQEKMDEVYQWRNGVFSRSRDFAKITPLTPQDIDRLSKKPSEGGILRDIRVSHYFFGYEKLPVLDTPIY